MPKVRSVIAAWRARKVEKALPAALNAACEALARRVADNAPVDTGRLRRSVHAVAAESGPSRIEAAVIVADQKGHLVEFGTVEQSPNPFFRRSIRAGLARFRKQLEAATGR